MEGRFEKPRTASEDGDMSTSHHVPWGGNVSGGHTSELWYCERHRTQRSGHVLLDQGIFDSFLCSCTGLMEMMSVSIG